MSKIYEITEIELQVLIEKIETKIEKILGKEGLSNKSTSLKNSISDTVKTYLTKIN